MANIEFTNRNIVLIIIASVILVQGTLFALTMSIVRSNGYVPYDFITMDGGDSHDYVALAERMLSEGRFAMTPTAAPETFRTPGYPLLVAVILAITGNIVFVPIVQIILTAISAALIFLIGTRFFNRTVGIISAILFSIDPAGPLVSFVSMADMMFVFLLLVSVYVLIRNENLSRRIVFLSGILIGVFALTRPIGFYIFPIIAVWLIYKDRENYKNALKVVGIFIVGVFLIVAPWMARNYYYYGHADISSIGIYNLLFYNIITFEHERTGVSKETLHEDILKQIGAKESDDYRSLAFTSQVKDVALKYILAHPIGYSVFHLISIVPFYIGTSIEAARSAVYGRARISGTVPSDINVSSLVLHGNYRGAFSALTANMPQLFERFVWLILCIASFVTAVSAVRRRDPYASVIVLFFALIVAFGVLTGPVSYPRYRLPAEPFIFILGVTGVLVGWERIKSLWYSSRNHAE